MVISRSLANNCKMRCQYQELKREYRGMTKVHITKLTS